MTEAPTRLTFTAEQVGHGSPPGVALAFLRPLLAHPKLYVREGALLGLVPHEGDAAVRRALTAYAAVETDATLLGIVADMLDG